MIYKKTQRKREVTAKKTESFWQVNGNQNKAPQTVEARGCADNPVQNGLSFAANDGWIIDHFDKKSINIKANAHGNLRKPMVQNLKKLEIEREFSDQYARAREKGIKTYPFGLELIYNSLTAYTVAVRIGVLKNTADETATFTSGFFSSNAWHIFYGWALRGIERCASFLCYWYANLQSPTHPFKGLGFQPKGA